MLQWIIEIFNFVQQGAWSVDLHTLYYKLSEEQRSLLVNEVFILQASCSCYSSLFARQVTAFDRFRASKFEKRNRKISTMLNR